MPGLFQSLCRATWIFSVSIPSGQHGAHGVVNCSCSSVLKIWGMLFRIRSTHAQLTEIPGVVTLLWGCFLELLLSYRLWYLQVPQLSLFALLARKLGSIFFTLSYMFYNCAHFWSQPTGGHREKETHAGLSHSHLWLQMKILLPQSSGLSQWLSCKESTVMQETQEIQVRSLGWEDPLEEGTATHSSILAWRILWTKEPGRLQPIGSHRVRHNWEAT